MSETDSSSGWYPGKFLGRQKPESEKEVSSSSSRSRKESAAAKEKEVQCVGEYVIYVVLFNFVA